MCIRIHCTHNIRTLLLVTGWSGCSGSKWLLPKKFAVKYTRGDSNFSMCSLFSLGPPLTSRFLVCMHDIYAMRISFF
jgi:hypothetical protein